MNSLRISNESDATAMRQLQSKVSDLIVAKQRINFATGVTPQFVRPPHGITNPAVFEAYERQDLQCIFWDVPTGDDTPGASYATITATLIANLRLRLLAQDTDITILFHDVHEHTADFMVPYLQTIASTVASAGGTIQFSLVEDGPDC
jgi:hypothetical protein